LFIIKIVHKVQHKREIKIYIKKGKL